MLKYGTEMLNKHCEFLSVRSTTVINSMTTEKKSTTKSQLQENKRKKLQQLQEKENDRKNWQRTLFP